VQKRLIITSESTSFAETQRPTLTPRMHASCLGVRKVQLVVRSVVIRELVNHRVLYGKKCTGRWGLFEGQVESIVVVGVER